MKFKNIYHNSEGRLEECLLSLWTPGSHAMRQSLKDLFKREPFVGEPLFQSAFGWKQVDSSSNWRDTFDPRVAKLMEDIGTKSHTRNWAPYTHQVESWNVLNTSTPGNAQSIVVTSGTGSGKTECFLYPVLNDLYLHKGEGVQAIFMYPLNALANDQKSRIEKCCSALGLTFACYHRDTNECGTAPACACEIESREAIRNRRPDLLLTNPSMLEYIMVRASDKPVMEPNNPHQTSSALRWIIIDEAHSYSGSGAVELRYEIRRVLDAFGAKIEDVHFACTSATIGGGSDGLVDFIHALTGQDPRRIHVISGSRVVPLLSSSQATSLLSDAGIPLNAECVLKLRDELNANDHLNCEQIWRILFPGVLFGSADIETLLDTLDSLCELSWTDSTGAMQFLLMARAHFFMREPSGLYACLNTNCPEHGQSPLGAITSIDQQSCPHCGSPLYELSQCRTCGEFMFSAQEDTATHDLRATRTNHNLEVDNIFADDNDESEDASPAPTPLGFGTVALYHGALSSRAANHSHLICFPHDLVFAPGGVTKKNAPLGQFVCCQTLTRTECCPHCGHQASGKMLSGFHLSMDTLKQVVTPALLSEATPNAGQHWGKYISFTDSRQKTAISAKNFNIATERNYAMSMILDCLTQNYLNSGSKTLRPYDVRNRAYSQDIFEHLTFDHSTPSVEGYKSAVLRGAIGRRLIRGTGSLESLGFMKVLYDFSTYPLPADLVTWNNAHPGSEVLNDQWHNYLKICLDYCVRLNNCIQPIGYNGSQDEKEFVRDNMPTQLNASSSLGVGERWPVVKLNRTGNAEQRQPRLVLLLCAALGICSENELDNPANQNLVDKLLVEAYNQLTGAATTTPILTRNAAGNGYFLDMSGESPFGSRCFLSLNESVEICPVTGSLLDVTFMGYSPMMKGVLSSDNINRYKVFGSPVKMPVMKIANPTDAQIRTWLDTDPDVAHLRNLGLWNNYMESLFTFRNVYVAAEHSAQLDRNKLEEYTNQFKGDPATPGRLNILNCSTTMEMGVDIGDIDTVFLSNVPPSSANYLQRAGRAGRFGQSKAVAFTTCSSSPAGLEAFFTPSKMLEDGTARMMPKVSAVLLKRHINSFFFHDFVVSESLPLQGNSSAANFFLSDSGTPSPCDAFVAHLRAMGQRLINKYNDLFGSIIPYGTAIADCQSMITQLATSFTTVYKELENEVLNNRGAAQTAASYHLSNFSDKNLLSFLSEKQFFPNANMPTGIVEFDASTKKQRDDVIRLRTVIRALKSALNSNQVPPGQISKKEAELSNIQANLKTLEKKIVVSNEAGLALNMYVPGQTVVVDEKNHLSYSLADRNTYGDKMQDKYLSTCPDCGYTRYSDSYPGMDPVLCPICGTGQLQQVGLLDGGAPFTKARHTVGYKADFMRSDDRQEAITHRYYQLSKLLPDFSWRSFIAMGACDIVGNEAGRVVQVNKGDGYGFAICDKACPGGRCGHAVVDVPWNEKPALDHSHRPKWSGHGIVNAPDVLRHVVLTSEDTTSYVAVRFYSDIRRKTELATKEFLYSMGTVLTKAFCEVIAIDRNEIGFGVNKTNGKNYLFIHDNNKGGAGYSTQLKDPVVFSQVIMHAYEMVNGYTCDCKEHDGEACAKCLLDRTTFSYAGLLSTKSVFDWLKSQMRLYRSVPASVATLSPLCTVEPRTLYGVLEDAVNNAAITRIDFFIPLGNDLVAGEWCNQAGRVRRLLREAQNNGKQVILHIEYNPSDNDLISIYRITETASKLSWLDGVEGAELNGTLHSALTLSDAAGTVQHFFTPESCCTPLSDNWGDKCNELYVDSVKPLYTEIALPSKTALLSALASGKSKVVDGTIPGGYYDSSSFFSTAVEPNVIGGDLQMRTQMDSILRGQHVKVSFADNYLVSPFACIILEEMIKELKDKYGLFIDSIDLLLDVSCCTNNSKIPIYDQKIIYNYDNQDDRDDFITDLMKKELGITPTIGINVTDHHRWLRFTNMSGDMVEIRPDHGIGAGWFCGLKHSQMANLRLPVKFTKDDYKSDTILYYVKYQKK